MLNFIYDKIMLVLFYEGKILRQLDRMESKIDKILIDLEPGPAVSVTLEAGSIQEQP